MLFRRTAMTAAVLSMYSIPVFASAAAVAADKEVPVLPTTKVKGESVEDYKIDDAQSPKFTAPLVNTPRSVTIISEELLRDTAATSLQDALRQVPGITFAAGEGGQPIADRPIIRGINSTSNVFVDGVRDIGTQTREVFDVESVEVMKGTDSVYAGRGSGGGSVNLVSKVAKGEEFTRGTMMIGTDDIVRATYDQNWKIGDDKAARLGVLGARGGVPGRDEAVDYDSWGVSPSLAFGLGSQSRVTLDFYHLEDNSMPDYSTPYDQTTGLPVVETQNVDRENFYGLVNRDFREAETDLVTLFLERDLDNGLHLRNVTRWGKSTNAYVVTNPDDSAGNVVNGYVWRNTKNRWSQNRTLANQTDLFGQIKTGAIEHSFDVGVELSREEKEQDGYTVTSAAAAFGRDCSSTEVDPETDMTYGELLIANGDCTSLYDPNPYDAWSGTVERTGASRFYQTDVTALYAFDTITFNPQWQLNVGLRWDSYETEVTQPSDPTNGRYNAYSSDDFINYQLGLVFKPRRNGTVYLSYGTETTPATLGSDDDGPSGDYCTSRGCTEANTSLEPEETVNIELGTKWQLFEDHLLLSFAIFDITRENATIEIESGLTARAGETSIQGAEISFTGAITSKWQVFGGYSFLDSELTKGDFDSVAVGEVLPNTPEHSFTLFSNYAITPSLTVGGGAAYVSEVYGSVTSDPKKKVPDYWRFDMMASWQMMKNAELQVNVQNLTDEVYYTKAYANHYASVGLGRHVLASVNFSF